MIKLLRVAMAVILVMCCTTLPAFAADVTNNWGLGEGAPQTEYVFNEDVHPEDTLELKLFVDASGSWEQATRAQVRGDNIKIKLQGKSNSALVESAKLEYRNDKAFVVIKFVETFKTIKDIDFTCRVQIMSGSDTLRDSVLEVSGTFVNHILTVDKDDESVYTGESYVIEAEDSVRRLNIETESGLTVVANLVKDTKYYVKSERSLEPVDLELAESLKADSIIYLEQIGLDRGNNHVILTLDDGKYYVYDAEGNFLGQSTDTLPVLTKYVLSPKPPITIPKSPLGNNPDLPIKPRDPVKPKEPVKIPKPAPTLDINQNPNTGGR